MNTILKKNTAKYFFWSLVILTFSIAIISHNQIEAQTLYQFENGTPADADQVNENFDYLESQVDLLSQKLAELEGKAGKWPEGNYCIFKSNVCPEGFTDQSGYMRAISLYSGNSSYIKQMFFGNSSIRCHGSCGQYGNWTGELNLNVCCK